MKHYDPNLPTQYIRAVDNKNNLLWEYELPKEPSALIMANIDSDVKNEILVVVDSTLIAFDLVESVNVASVKLNSVPDCYTLQQNFPTPFNSLLNIRFNLAKSSNVTLKVYNLLGKEIARL